MDTADRATRQFVSILRMALLPPVSLELPVQLLNVLALGVLAHSYRLPNGFVAGPALMSFLIFATYFELRNKGYQLLIDTECGRFIS